MVVVDMRGWSIEKQRAALHQIEEGTLHSFADVTVRLSRRERRLIERAEAKEAKQQGLAAESLLVQAV